MRGPERQILRLVKEKGETTSASVARGLGVSPGYASRLLSALASDGHLERIGDELYAITEKGRLLLEPYKGRFPGQVPVSNYP